MIELRPRGYTRATVEPGLQAQKYTWKTLPSAADIWQKMYHYEKGCEETMSSGCSSVEKKSQLLNCENF